MTIAINYRRIRERDLPLLRSWRNNPDVARHMYTDHQISDNEHREWFARCNQNSKLSYWIIELDGVPVGLANVAEIDFDTKSANWAFYLADASTRGRGVGLFTEYCVLDYAFNYLELDVLRCEVLESNSDVRAMHESVGFAVTGRVVGRTIKDGQPVDAIAYSMTRQDWTNAHCARIKGRIQARGQHPIPMLSAFESTEAEGEISASFFDRTETEIARMRARRLV